MTVSFYLTRPKAEEPTAIFARISYNGNQVKYYTPESILPRFWNGDTHRARETKLFKEFPEFNQRLNNFESDIKNTYRTYTNNNGGLEPSPALLRSLLDKEFSKTKEQDEHERKLKTFWGFFNDFLHRSESGTRLHLQNHTPLAANTIKNFNNLKHHLEGYQTAKRKKLDFDLIDLKFYQAFTMYLTAEKGLGINTIGKLVTNLKVLLREAWEAGLTTNTSFTHRKFKSYQVQTDAVYLTDTEIKSLQEIDLSGTPRLDRVRDMFIVGCYTGLRFSDFSRLTYNNIIEDTIHIRQLKTADPVYVPVRAELRRLFQKYPEKLPAGVTNQEFNRTLKEVCRKCPALEKEVMITRIEGGKRVEVRKPKHEFIASHTARRSFATNEYLAGDLQTFEIRAITGHKTDKAFYKYIRMTPKENAANVAKKWQEREQRRAAIVPHLKAV